MMRYAPFTCAVAVALTSLACTNNADTSAATSSSSGVIRPDAGNGASSGGQGNSAGGSSGAAQGSSSSSSASNGGSSGAVNNASSSSASAMNNGSSAAVNGSSNGGNGSSSGGGNGNGSSGGPAVSTIAALKALIAADTMCAQSTSACQYNTMPFHDFAINGAVVMSEQHSDFDNKARDDAGVNVAQKAIYLADHDNAAANEGIELIAPPYFNLPVLTAGDIVNVEGSLRVNFGNTYFRVLRIFKKTDGGLHSVTPVTVTEAQVANTQKGVENMDGGCATNNIDNSTEGEPFEGSLVDVTLDTNGVPIIYHPVADGGVAHRFSLNNNIMVSDNFGILSLLQVDGGLDLTGKVTKLRGFSYFSFGCRKIQPRSVDDITIVP